MKKLLTAALIVAAALALPLAGVAQTVQVDPATIQGAVLTVPLITNSTSTVSFTNDSDAELLPLTLMQDIATTAASVTNALVVTYTPYGNLYASNATFRVAAPTTQVAGSEAVQALTSYPVLRKGDVLTFSSTVGVHAVAAPFIKLYLTYARF